MNPLFWRWKLLSAGMPLAWLRRSLQHLITRHVNTDGWSLYAPPLPDILRRERIFAFRIYRSLLGQWLVETHSHSALWKPGAVRCRVRVTAWPGSVKPKTTVLGCWNGKEFSTRVGRKRVARFCGTYDFANGLVAACTGQRESA